MSLNKADSELARTDWIDATKGAMITLVVIGHAWRGLYASDLVPAEIFHAVDSRIYAFHMPVFFALSGWFFVSSLEKITLSDFYQRRVLRLLWPMVLWTYIFLCLKALAGPFSNSPIQMSEVFVLPVPGVLHMWFLWALFLLTICFSWLKFFSGDGITANSAWLVAVASVAALQFVNLGPEVDRWIGQAVRSAPFFLLGVIAGRKGVIQNVTPRGRVLAGAVFMVLLFYWPGVERAGLSQSGSLVLTICILMYFSGITSLKSSGVFRALAVLGAASLPVYLAHTIFSAATREALLVYDINILSVHLLLGTIAGLSGPLILLHLTRRKGVDRLLGF